MPTKMKPLRDLPKIPRELLKQFGEGLISAEAIEDASAAFKKALIERALSAELGHHLGYPPGAQRPEDETNQRNGKSGRTVLTGDGPPRLETLETEAPGCRHSLNDLGFERFRIRASLAHGNPGDKGDRVRLKRGGHDHP